MQIEILMAVKSLVQVTGEVFIFVARQGIG
jgi:hypothetical protein